MHARQSRAWAWRGLLSAALVVLTPVCAQAAALAWSVTAAGPDTFSYGQRTIYRFDKDFNALPGETITAFSDFTMAGTFGYDTESMPDSAFPPPGGSYSSSGPPIWASVRFTISPGASVPIEPLTIESSGEASASMNFSATNDYFQITTNEQRVRADIPSPFPNPFVEYTTVFVVMDGLGIPFLEAALVDGKAVPIEINLPDSFAFSTTALAFMDHWSFDPATEQYTYVADYWTGPITSIAPIDEPGTLFLLFAVVLAVNTGRQYRDRLR